VAVKLLTGVDVPKTADADRTTAKGEVMNPGNSRCTQPCTRFMNFEGIANIAVFF
jgi:hypothetical protein